MHTYIGSAVEQNRLSLKLKPIFIGQLALIKALHNPGFTYDQGEFKVILQKNEGITPDFISFYARNDSKEIFIHLEDYTLIQEKLKNDLTLLTRSLSIGDPLKNATKHVNMLTMQMSNLYDDPFNSELLANHFQQSKNLFNLLYTNKKIQKSLYMALSKQAHHYTHAQPLLASVLLQSLTQSIGIFTEKELQNLFLTSYFKDIGMSFIPREKFELSHLSDFDKKLFEEHANNSLKILDGRVPFSRNQLNIIENHHFLNYKIQSQIHGPDKNSREEFISGIESTLLSAVDIFVAMTHDRPYRDPVTPFEALALIKQIISDDYPQEFRSIVIFFKSFFKN